MRTICFSVLCLFLASSHVIADELKPLKALLIAGGCCHDYAGQQKEISEGIQARANVQVDVYWTDQKGTNPALPLYDQRDWADGYDVIIHDECAASNKDVETVKRILKVHENTPAVHLHCAMHSFRNGTDLWFKHLGLQSSSHGPQAPIQISFVDTQHPITQGLEDWLTIKEELYNNVRVFDAHPLATGTQLIKRGPKTTEAKAVVVWTNEKQGAKSFSTSLGHNTETVKDDRYLDLITRGLLWTCNRLNADYLKPFQGKNNVRFNDGVAAAIAKQEADKQAAAMAKLNAKRPKDSALVKIFASSTQHGNELVNSIDQDPATRWCAENGSFPQWLAFEFEKAVRPKSIRLQWEFEKAYQYVVEGSVDQKKWTVLLDQSNNSDPSVKDLKLATKSPVKFVRVRGIGSSGGWCSIREVKMSGQEYSSIWPAATNAANFQARSTLGDPYKSSGNIAPTIVPLTPQQEAEYLKRVQVPEGFDVTLFAAPPAVNYPVFVAAAPDGTLYVSSDGNGSLGRDPNRGRVIRLRDLDGDGRADETKVFCNVESPRGLVWDHDRLYLMHPPHLSVFIDKDSDGVADEQKILVKNLAFGYDKRPADHTTNGLSLGVDGYLYVAGGDFGFMEAEGSDGTKLQHRGGGVIRVRPDGTGLELYSTGTRNILEVAVSPRMDLFARDNTNDGGGWDVRFHHFTGGEDHGYPRLYKNFAEESVPALADYGGGSGCGAAYLDEPGFGEWNDAPLTADWGKGAIFHHRVEPAGATFRESRPPEPFVKLERATDADVDAMSRLYCASWRGATFKWAGPKAGFIVRVTPKDFQPKTLPSLTELSNEQLVGLFDSDSYRRRLAAQRELFRRGQTEAGNLLLKRGKQQRTRERNLIDHLRGAATDIEVVAALAHMDAVIQHTAVRELARRNASEACFQALDQSSTKARPLVLRALSMMHDEGVVRELIKRVSQPTSDANKLRLLDALCRLYHVEGNWNGQSWGTRPDTRGPYYQPETWQASAQIAAVLKESITELSPSDTASLIITMSRNRIQFNESTERLIQLAASDDELLGKMAIQIMKTGGSPTTAFPLLIKAVELQNLDVEALAAVGTCLSRYDRAEALPASIRVVEKLDTISGASRQRDSLRRVLTNSRLVQNQVQKLCSLTHSESPTATWAYAFVLEVAAKKNASPEAKVICEQTVDAAWSKTESQLAIIQLAAKLQLRYLDDRIVDALEDADPRVAAAAQAAAKRLRLSAKPKVDSPKVKTMDLVSAATQAINTQGDRQWGERLFKKANCSACHTVSKAEPQKGPFLGNIAQTYKRKELVAAILEPNKTIAQGFATTQIVTVDGESIIGFVTQESADKVTLRDKDAKEHVVLKNDVEIRKTATQSVMPTGLMDDYTVHDLASIVDYLQWLSQPK